MDSTKISLYSQFWAILVHIIIILLINKYQNNKRPRHVTTPPLYKYFNPMTLPTFKHPLHQFSFIIGPKLQESPSMAISQTMSNPFFLDGTMSNPSDWMFQPYQNDFSHTEASPANAFAAATAAASRNNHLSPEQGRVSKPIRRRSRASRRTPTTLLNTDTTNFRAMVQHFTGGPAAGNQILNRGCNTVNYMDHAAASGFHVQYPNQLQPQHVFMIDNMQDGGSGGGLLHPAANGNRSYDNTIL